MSSEIAGNEILDQYRNISNKLKKRFLRKPNVTEACESFAYLGQQCENEHLPAYAGLCWIAAARCEGSLANIPGETAALIRAARQFLHNEKQNHSLGFHSLSSENLQAALNCYAHASSRYPENNSLPIQVNFEIVEALKRLNQPASIEMYLKNTLNLCENSLDTKLFCLESLANHYTETGDYTSALDMYGEMSNVIETKTRNAARNDLLLQCEINKVFLLLILRPPPQTLTQNMAKLLEKYTWSDTVDKSLKVCGMSEQLFILLQSIVLSCQSMDRNNLVRLEGEMWPYLSTAQKELLRILVQSY